MKNLKTVLFFLAIFILCCRVIVFENPADNDLWHRLAVGSAFFQNGWIMNHDIFAYTPTKELWIDHEWGSGVIFYGLSHYFGDSGLIFLKIFLLFITLIIIYAIIRLVFPEEERHRIEFYVIAFFALFPGFGTTIRCQVFTYLFFALWIYVLERVRRGENRLIWIFPATMLVWVNLHGGFVSGFGLLAIYFTGELLNKKNPIKYLYIMALTIPVTLINPYGINFWHYMIEAVTMPRPYITEWGPLNLFGPLKEWIFFKIMILITLIGWGYKLISREKNIDWVKLIVVLLTLFIALKHHRHMVFFVIATCAFSCHYFYAAVKDLFKNIVNQKTNNIINFSRLTMMFIFIFLGSYYIFITPFEIKVKANEYPAEAVEFIKINKLKGNLLVPFNWGSYALWKLHPQCLVSIDGRYEEVYTNEVYLDNINFDFFNEGWENALKKYHNDIILTESSGKTYNKLQELNNWKNIYKDKYSAVFIPSFNENNKWILPDSKKDYSKLKYLSNINFL